MAGRPSLWCARIRGSEMRKSHASAFASLLPHDDAYYGDHSNVVRSRMPSTILTIWTPSSVSR